MFRQLRVRRQPPQKAPEPGGLSAERLAQDSNLPIALRQINSLAENANRRIYRALLPPGLLTQFGIDPITWKGADGELHVRLNAEPESGVVALSAWKAADDSGDVLFIGLADNAFNGIDLNLLLLGDPDSPRFRTDYDEEGRPTLFGTARRNRTEEALAMQAGLAPAQVRSSLGASRAALGHLETFLAALGHRAFFLEPLTYVSAWLFERRGFAYVRGHKLMDDIHREFQPGGRLHLALDGRSPYQQHHDQEPVQSQLCFS